MNLLSTHLCILQRIKQKQTENGTGYRPQSRENFNLDFLFFKA